MDRNDITGLIETLCDAPLDGEGVLSAELLALRYEAAKALGREVLADTGDDAPDAEALTAALAAVLSGSANEAARKTLAELVARSAASRLDVESALALVEAIERSAETAPAHLIAQLIGPETATAPARRAATESFWSRITGSFRLPRAYRIATACAVALLASAATWSLYWSEHAQVPLAPLAKTESAASAVERAVPAVADAPPLPAPPAPALAARQRQRCEPQESARKSSWTRSTSVAAEKAKDSATADPGCEAAPANDADAAIRQAREQAEQARQNAAVPESRAPAAAAATAPSAIGATRSDPISGAAQRPAPTLSAPAPAAKPTTRPAELSR